MAKARGFYGLAPTLCRPRAIRLHTPAGGTCSRPSIGGHRHTFYPWACPTEPGERMVLSRCYVHDTRWMGPAPCIPMPHGRGLLAERGKRANRVLDILHRLTYG